jgi:hypothetical protein
LLTRPFHGSSLRFRRLRRFNASVAPGVSESRDDVDDRPDELEPLLMFTDMDRGVADASADVSDHLNIDASLTSATPYGDRLSAVAADGVAELSPRARGSSI